MQSLYCEEACTWWSLVAVVRVQPLKSSKLGPTVALLMKKMGFTFANFTIASVPVFSLVPFANLIS
ncbi:uncharacterized protein PHALS_14625 [Plasmopara halstedii]|uniref:Uncharacterized protein n=1 Tax=Plasmopara halstedii TaxID=4781 RepID=A0A0P1AML0_PLAHL|nr:uncharacterized protein PHALS_14625 [Plasmopara halstedii]CEG42432.1 hypothetical protein PHALS_14625 [Plasmopara halstedii]|eukprot:XP_024578801.1 hypothetical protein PHALS_14625 [Plasmopara halstedii]